MYLERAGEEDKKMTDTWKADADGILIFVSPDFTFNPPSNVTSVGIDWFILCRGGNVGRSIGSGPSAKLPGYLRILPRKHLSNPCQFKWN